MHGWGVFPSKIDLKFVKLIYSIKTKLIISFFFKFLVKFLKNRIKYVVSRAISGARSGARKVALFNAHSKMIPENEGKNEYAALKLIG